MLSEGEGQEMRSERKGVDPASSFTASGRFRFCAQGSGSFLELGTIRLRFPFWKASTAVRRPLQRQARLEDQTLAKRNHSA